MTPVIQTQGPRLGEAFIMTELSQFFRLADDPKNDLRQFLSAWLFDWTPVGVRKGPGLLATLNHLSKNEQCIPILHAYGRQVADLAEPFLGYKGSPTHDAGRLHAFDAVTFGRGHKGREPCAVSATAAYLKACRMIYGSDPITIAKFVAKGKSTDRWLDFIELHEADSLSKILIDLLLNNDLII